MTMLLLVVLGLALVDGSGPGAQGAPGPVRVIIETEAGEIEAEIDTVRAPITAANFLKYVDAGLFDGGRFFRTVRPDNQVEKPVKIAVIQAAASRERRSEFFPAIPLERTNVTGCRTRTGRCRWRARLLIRRATRSRSASETSPPWISAAPASPTGRGSRPSVRSCGHGRRAQDPGLGRRGRDPLPGDWHPPRAAPVTASICYSLEMMLKLATVTLVALFSLSPPYEQDTAALKREIEALKAQQAEMQRDLDAIRAFLQQMIVEKAQAAMVNTPIVVAGAPASGAATAKVMMVEVSDYHCPFCRRHTLTTQPQIDTEYINTGKLRYAFIDYPIDQLHPDAFKAHEAANCAGEQGKYWEMHAKLFESPPARDGAQLVPQLVAQAQGIGLDVAKFRACFDGGKYATPVKDNVARMQALGVDSTPTFLIGLTPAPGQPMKVVKVVRGAVPFAQFKAAFDAVLSQ